MRGSDGGDGGGEQENERQRNVHRCLLESRVGN
jgi:hypothetical protein